MVAVKTARSQRKMSKICMSMCAKSRKKFQKKKKYAHSCKKNNLLISFYVPGMLSKQGRKKMLIWRNFFSFLENARQATSTFTLTWILIRKQRFSGAYSKATLVKELNARTLVM